jgi:hypothetical protein
MPDLPDGAYRWSVNPEISKVQLQNMTNAVFFSLAGFISLLVIFKVLSMIGLMNFYSGALLTVIIAWFLWNIFLKTNSRMLLLNMVAIGEGHPWHPSEEIGDTSVWVSDGDNWHVIPKKTRLFATADPILERTLLKKNDEYGKILLTWPYSPNLKVRKVISLVNQALAFQDAQDKEEGEVDPIETARARESREFYPVERKWEETTPGTITPQPGALLRQIKVKGFDIVEKDKE